MVLKIGYSMNLLVKIFQLHQVEHLPFTLYSWSHQSSESCSFYILFCSYLSRQVIRRWRDPVWTFCLEGMMMVMVQARFQDPFLVPGTWKKKCIPRLFFRRGMHFFFLLLFLIAADCFRRGMHFFFLLLLLIAADCLRGIELYSHWRLLHSPPLHRRCQRTHPPPPLLLHWGRQHPKHLLIKKNWEININDNNSIK